MILNKLKSLQYECVGCGNCTKVCPDKALTLEINAEGFLTAVFNEEKCRECKKCIEVCPQIDISTNNSQRPECCLAVAQSDIVSKSTAGGVFPVLAQDFISQGGYVCAVAMNGNRAEYTLIHEETEIAKLTGAKYIEAALGNVFQEIKELLENQKSVLFCGTPCHVAAIYKYLSDIDIGGLTTIDFVCHGVSSPYVLDTVLQRIEKNKGRVEAFNFTTKKYGFRPDLCEAKLTNGSFIFDKDFIFFHNTCMSLHSACYNCQFAELPRLSDITLSVFYGIENFNPAQSLGDGTSLVLFNSVKGRTLFMNNKDKFESTQKVPIRFAIENNRFFSQYLKNKKRSRLFDFIKSKRSVEDIQHYIKEDYYDIVVAANWSSGNFGAHLTHYAMYSALTDMGYEVLMLEKPDIEPWRPLSEPILFRENPYHDYALSHLFGSLEEMRSLNMRCNTFIVASDQVWNYDLFGHSFDFYTLSFAGEDKTKISYSTSFGCSSYNAPDEIKKRFSAALRTFNSVSVREETGADICKTEFNVQAQRVLDPVFIADKKSFDKLIEKSKAYKSNPYVFIYVLSPDKNAEKMLIEYSNEKNCEPLCLKDVLSSAYDLKDKWTLPTVNTYTEDWLYYLKNASYIFTDTFHTVCFSIIYRKNFTCIIDPKSNEYSIISSLLTPLGLENRIVSCSNDCYDEKKVLNLDLMNDIDYDSVYKKLDTLIEGSKEWLKEALIGTMEEKSQINAQEKEDEKV